MHKSSANRPITNVLLLSLLKRKSSFPRNFVHIGMPKAASTYLQTYVFAKHSEINYLGKRNVSSDLNLAGAQIVRRPSINYQASHVAGIFQTALKGHPFVNLYSEEDLCTYNFLDVEMMVRRLSEIFGSYEAVYVHRKQVEWIQSLYYFYISTFKPDVMSGINPWLGEQLNFRIGSSIVQFQSDKMLEIYNQSPAVKKLHILPFELLKSDRIKFYTQLAHTLKVDAQQVLDLSAAGRQSRKSSKTRIGVFQANFIRSLNYLQNNEKDKFYERVSAFLPFIGSEAIREDLEYAISCNVFDRVSWIDLLRRGLSSLDEIENPGFEIESDEIDDDILKRIQFIARKSNKNIEKNFGVELETYGYY